MKYSSVIDRVHTHFNKLRYSPMFIKVAILFPINSFFKYIFIEMLLIKETVLNLKE